MKYLKVGIFSLLITVLLGLVGIPLQAGSMAARLACANYTAGALFGISLAMATRTRNPWQIYFWLILAGATLWPLWVAWPPGGHADVVIAEGMPGWLEAYPGLLRPLTFLLGLPFPFAVLGQHGPDPLPENGTE